MTALSIVQNACRRLGLDVPQALFSSTDPVIVQMVGIMNEALLEVAAEHQWSILRREMTFTTIAAELQENSPDPFPDDLEYYIQDTMYNRTQDRKMMGSVSPQDWQRLKGYAVTGIDIYFKIVGKLGDGNIYIYPAPTAGETVAYEYMSGYPVVASDSVGSASVGFDYELPYFMSRTESAALNNEDLTPDYQRTCLDEELVTQCLIWKWKQKKGFDYAEDFSTYQNRLEKEISRDGGRKKLSLKGVCANPFLPNIPEDGFGA